MLSRMEGKTYVQRKLPAMEAHVGQIPSQHTWFRLSGGIYIFRYDILVIPVAKYDVPGVFDLDFIGYYLLSSISILFSSVHDKDVDISSNVQLATKKKNVLAPSTSLHAHPRVLCERMTFTSDGLWRRRHEC